MNLNTIDNNFERNKEKQENIFYSNTIENLNERRNRNFNDDLNDEEIIYYKNNYI